MLIWEGWKNKTEKEEKYWINKVQAGEREARLGLAWCNIKCASEIDGQDPRYYMYFPLIITTLLISSHGVRTRYSVLRLNIDWKHTHSHTHTQMHTHRQVHAQYSTTVKFWSGWVHAASPQAHWVLYFLNRVKIRFLFSLSNSVSLFLWQMAHHSQRRSQTADSTNKLISITVLHASSLLIWLAVSSYTSTVLGCLYEAF